MTNDELIGTGRNWGCALLALVVISLSLIVPYYPNLIPKIEVTLDELKFVGIIVMIMVLSSFVPTKEEHD